MGSELKTEPIKNLTTNKIEPLIECSLQENFNFLSRLKNDWLIGANRFDQTNEELCQIRKGEQIIAIGGINNNPYKEAKNVGRIRHLYVLPQYRRKGIGKKLVLYLIDKYKEKYETITLRTDTEEAAQFYEALGFKKVEAENHTHEY